MKRKKIVEVIPQLNSGGAERFVVDLCNEMIKYHDITLIVLFPLETHGFYLNEINSRIKIISLNKKTGKSLNLLFRLYHIIKNEKANIVHTHLNSFYYCAYAMMRLIGEVKFFHTIHNDAYQEAPGKFGVKVKKLFLIRKLFTPITISKSSNKSFSEVYNIKAALVYNGRNLNFADFSDCKVINYINDLKTNKQTKILINVARISKQKNQILLVDSVIELNKIGYDIHLIILGSHLDNGILNKIKNFKSDKIHLLGERNNVIDFVRIADGFCLSSLHEGLPISLIESMAVGTIPICTPAGGIKDILDTIKDGFMSKDFTKEGYIKTLKKFLNTSEDDLKVRKSNCIKKSKDLSIENCSIEYLKHFKI